MKVITFSTKFPSYHSKKGKPTHFVKKILNALNAEMETIGIYRKCDVLGKSLREWNSQDLYYKVCDLIDYLPHGIQDYKHHTIRAGKRWRKGDECSLRIWSDKPYRSKQITLCNTKLFRVADFERIDGKCYVDGIYTPYNIIATNDGLLHDDFDEWIGENFSGQILFFSNIKTPY